MAEIVGNADKALNPYLKAWIKPEGSDILVCGVIGQGTSRQLQANWNSPFEQSSVGASFEKAGGAIQSVTGNTSKSTLSSEQIWDGNRPTSFSLVLVFYALADAFKEVVRPLALLEQMASPQVNNLAPGGRIPFTVTINIGRISVLTNCVIESIDTPVDKEKTSDGLLVRAEANLQISSKNMLNADEVLASWGAGGSLLY